MELPNLCPHCGYYGAPLISKRRQGATCPQCERFRPLRIAPLYIVTGASAVGKSAVIAPLRAHLAPRFLLFDKDQIWLEDAQQLAQHCLRVAFSAAQCGITTLLCGLFLPETIAGCDVVHFFEPIYWLNLHCSDRLRAERLRARPAWRNWNEARIVQNAAMAAQLQVQLPSLDASALTLEETALAIAQWVNAGALH